MVQYAVWLIWSFIYNMPVFLNGKCWRHSTFEKCVHNIIVMYNVLSFFEQFSQFLYTCLKYAIWPMRIMRYNLMHMSIYCCFTSNFYCLPLFLDSCSSISPAFFHTFSISSLSSNSFSLSLTSPYLFALQLSHLLIHQDRFLLPFTNL